MFRGLMYGSYQKPRELVWILGMLIYLVLMAEAFMGYVLPWGQMSVLGREGDHLAVRRDPGHRHGLTEWIMGDYLPATPPSAASSPCTSLRCRWCCCCWSCCTSARCMRSVRTTPTASRSRRARRATAGRRPHRATGIPFHPYYTVKDLFGTGFFLIIAAFIIFFAPAFGGWFLEHDNFVEANRLLRRSTSSRSGTTRPYYAMLRVIPHKLSGVIVMFSAIAVLFLVPWLDKSRSSRSLPRLIFQGDAGRIFVVCFRVAGRDRLGPGTNPVEETGSVAFPAHLPVFRFLLTMPVWAKIELDQGRCAGTGGRCMTKTSPGNSLPRVAVFRARAWPAAHLPQSGTDLRPASLQRRRRAVHELLRGLPLA
jgi:ubiquinol-cytochrome c reductase cytochrome b subunit